MLLVGVVARAQGNRGEVVVNATTDFPEERFAAGQSIWCRRADGVVDRQTIRVSRMHLGRPVLHFEGVGSIGDAERFAGAELRVPAAAQHTLPPHVYYRHELIGCEVWTAEGARVGTVTAVEGEGDATRLVVATAASEVLVPFVQAYCTVDTGRRRIEIVPPEGLLDLNGAWRT